jgi:hypothetical protein
LVGRPKSDDPRSEVVSFRLTTSERALLEAVAAVDRVRANEAAHQLVLRGLEAASRDPLVRDQLRLHARADARRAEVVPLRRPKTKDA